MKAYTYATLVNAIDQRETIRNFSIQVDKLEDACAYVVEQDHVLQQSSIQDGTSLMQLSVEAFDGRPMTLVLEQLEASWRSLLNQLTNSIRGMDEGTNQLHETVFFVVGESKKG
ncbi:hypothetical protein DYU11_02130 [Fibrisoma montanum]|uniref:Uncharacterized protein n=1 Tax=Fibrisoma montanum TaxID=2305895 RepID=A0A418MI93_9BACT|nr:hypothetical protein [Fibrisoma montanum]RIV27136.1 hypothetical protein DYU11_02130 [Fibrisoma montanum]